MMEGKNKSEKAAMEFKKGMLLLADVVDYTSQANRLGDQKTAAFNEHFEKKIRELSKAYQGIFIKRIGDAVLIFFEDEKPFLDFVIQLRELSRIRCLDLYDFFADLRMVAHYGNFSFKTIEEKLSDLIGPEGIKVFRIEKYAGEYDVIITNSMLGIIRNLLDEKNISFTNLETVKLKGFDEDAFLYKLNFPVKDNKAASTLLCVKMEALEAETRVIPVFGDLYSAMNMEDNFINLDIKTGDKEKWSGTGKYFSKREMEGEWEEREGMPGIDLKMKREKERERPGYVDVKTLYNLQNRSIILGFPGSGKTTILKYFAFREFKENRKILEEDKKRVVLFIPCRNIPGYNEWQRLRSRDEKKADASFNVETLLFYLTCCFLFNKEEVKQDKEKQELRIAEKLVHQAYIAGRLTLLIDALDEAPGKRIKEDIIVCVKELFTDLSEGPRKGKANRVFLTSRYSEREMYFSGKGVDMLRPQFEVCSLDMDQLREMARYFYGEETDLYKEFDDIVWREEIAARVGGTPITALLVIAYYEIFRKFDTRYHMYNIIVIFILVRVWKQIKEKHFNKDMRIFFKEAKSKEVLKEEKNAWEIYDALSLLSYEYLDKGTVINEEDIVGIFELFAREKVEEKEAAAEAEQWLKQMKEDHLLVSAGANEYVFIHNTVMEYLAARYIVEKLDDPLYLETFFEIHDLIKDLAQKGPAFFAAEILPIAVGSGIKNGAALMRIIHDCIHKVENRERKELLYQLALKSLAEFESFIDRQYRRKKLDLLHRKMEEEIEDNRDAVDWIYKYLARILLSRDKEKLKEWAETFKNIPCLTRPYFFQRYLHYDKFKRGDSEIVSLREALLYSAFNSELVERWLGEHRKAEEKVLPDSLLTLESSGYHPEDKNFRYYRQYTGKELIGFLGSPNLKHSGPVTCVAVSPDGKTLLSGSVDYTLKLWDAATGKEMRTFKGHSSGVTSVGFAPDGKTLLSGSHDETLKLWDAATGKEIRTFKGHEVPVTGVGFAPDGKTVLSGSVDYTLKLWDVATGKEMRTFKGHSSGVTSVGFAPDGKTLLSGSDDSTLKLWDAATGKEIRTFKGHTATVWSGGFAPDGKTLLSGSWDSTLKLWDAATGKEIRTFKGHSNWVNGIGFAPDGKTLLSGSWDYTLKLWDAATGKEIRTFKGHSNWVTGVGFAPDGKTLLSGSHDETLKLWDAATGKEIRTFKGHTNMVRSVGFAPDGKTVLSGSVDSTLKLWDAATGKAMRTFKGHSYGVNSVCFAPDGRTVLSGSDDHTLKLWDAATGKAMRTFKGHEGYVTSVGFAPDGRTVLSGSDDHTLKLWDAATGKAMRTFNGHEGYVTSVGFVPDGKTVLSGSSDSTLKIWDIQTGQCIKTIPLLWTPYDIKAFPGKPGVFATANGNGTVTLFDFREVLSKK